MPKAFSQALATCQFEQGDRLYDTPKAYVGEWHEAQKHIRHAIQILQPERGSLSRKESSASVFHANWSSEVVLELQTVNEPRAPQTIRTTQGRLFTALWHGDLLVLHGETDDPEPPLQLRNVPKQLEQISDFASRLIGSGCVFAMARDMTNSTSRGKHRGVGAMLRTRHGAIEQAFTPSEIGVPGSDRISPTIELVFYIMKAAAPEAVEKTVKSVLYKPSANAGADNFKIEGHGQLIGCDQR